jgi:hypothetical protein
MTPIGTSKPRAVAVGLLCLIAVITVAYANIIFLGETLVATTNYNPIDNRNSGLGYENWHDQGAVWWQWEPAGEFFSRAYRQGRLPLWDTTIAGGVNSHANVTQGQYFPPYVLLLLAGNSPLLRDIYYLLMLLASGFACFLLLRRNGFHLISAVFMGSAWMLGGTMTQNVNAFLGQTYATLPWLVLAVDLALDKLTWRALGTAALLVGLCTYSTFLPIVISGYVLIGIQALVYAGSAFRSPSTRGGLASVRTLLAFGGVVSLAIGMAAFFLLPLTHAVNSSASFHTYYTGIGAMAYSLDLLPTVLSPRLFYDVWQTIPREAAFIPKPVWYTTHFFYVGVTTALLLACVKKDQRFRVRRLTWFFGVAAVALIAKLMGIPPIQWIAYLPVFKFLHFIPYFSGAFALAIVGLAACGLETVVTQGCTRRRFVCIAGVAAAIVALIPLFIWWRGFNNAPTPATMAATIRYFLELGRVLLVIGGVLAVLWWRRSRQSKAVTIGLLLLVLVGVELVPTAFHRRSPRADLWNSRVPPYVRYLQNDATLFRIASTQQLALFPNTFQPFGIAGISSLGVFNQPRYTELINAYYQTELNSGFILPTSLLPSKRPILDLLNVKYLVTYMVEPEKEAELQAAGLITATIDERFKVFRNPTVWPRAFVAHNFQVMPDRKSAVLAAATGTPDIAILESPPQFASGGGPATRCDIVLYEPNRLNVIGDDSSAGMLVLLDSYGDGWTATVNGAPAPIVPAYGAFRGVQVPAGRWQVAMEYRVPRLEAGLVVVTAALAIALMALCASRSLPGHGVYFPEKLSSAGSERADATPAARESEASS